ncbi:Oxoglutarate/iron-dependent oxygenase [Cordyceps fumosorosea ARSEF 2679]|uniref:Oxoglutarate/iron-dependent oxygenase n=1 Tax=Cordyceps fumosorosea (strain ARSEF 2679) TaxID=1081104 RepID=A0A167N4U2_CORFA|nr:Oxoglutarate/iron-dependent oxygenase [Cordyceps fumosorosea ARSEF 2679]OAA55127.1 Oxoglutarate/iron-dependent oxygenase [Cordyceps fumosorosea ARSEF 2679]
MGDSVHDLPIVDLGASSLEEQGAQLCKAFRQVGLAYVKNHGIPEEEIEEAFSWSRKFFDLPQSEKDKAPHPPEGWYHRGYSRVGLEKVSQNVFDADSLAQHRKVPDQKESFDLGSDGPAAAMRNIWPPAATLPGFRDACMRFFDACGALGERLLAAVAVGLGLPPEFFAERHARRDHQLRLLHYPPFAASLQARGLAEGVGAHSDFGTVTLLFQDDVGGLEVEDRSGGGGGFKAVPRVEGAVVVNVGDMLMRWTNDELRSPIHRVRTPAEEAGEEGTGVRMTRRRYSMPFFVGADPGTVVDCAPTCHGPERPKRYDPVTVEEYCAMRMNALY